MPAYFRISVRFLDGEFHGRGDGGVPEWPPSPLRLFQALVAASAARWNERRGIRRAAPALRWLESLPPPTIIAPPHASGAPYRLYVPDNVGDLVGKSWSKGGDASIANFRTEKTVCPTRIEKGGAVHFVWSIGTSSPESDAHLATLLVAARSITHLGWGVDLVVAEAAIIKGQELEAISGRKWVPTEVSSDTNLRTPGLGTLDDLERRYQAFLQRVGGGVHGETFSPVPPLNAIRSISYRSETNRERQPVAVFALRQLHDSGFRSFDPLRRGLHVAAMLRHALGNPEFVRSQGWSDAHVAALVHGHSGFAGTPVKSMGRFMFLPVPSVEFRSGSKIPTISGIRRVLLTALGAVNLPEFERCCHHMAGLELVDERSAMPTTVLSRIPSNDPVTRHYLEPATTWATVTPVVLPGYDDPRKLRRRLREQHGLSAEEKRDIIFKLDRRIDLLLRKALQQAGYSEELTSCAGLEWRASGYFPGTDLASRYVAGDQHRRFRKVHVRIHWRDRAGKDLQIPGPIVIGSGKFSGCGLFARI